MDQRAAHTAGVGFGRGESLALLAALCYAVVNALLRSVAGEIDPFLGSLVRQLPLFAIVVTLLVILRPPVVAPRAPEFFGPRTVAALLAAGTVSFLIGNVLLFLSLDWAGLAVATAATQGGVVVGGALSSWIVLREPPPRWQLAGAGVILVGLCVIAAPGIDPDRGLLLVPGLLLGVATGFCYTVANTVSRHAQRRPRSFLGALALTNIGGVVALAVTCLVRMGGDLVGAFAHLTGFQLTMVFLAGAVNVIAICSVTLSVRYTTVTRTSTITSLMIVFSTLIAWLVFQEEISVSLLIGSALILLGVFAGQLTRRVPDGAPPPDDRRGTPAGITDNRRIR